jgi:hypothetical protein
LVPAVILTPMLEESKVQSDLPQLPFGMSEIWQARESPALPV